MAHLFYCIQYCLSTYIWWFDYVINESLIFILLFKVRNDITQYLQKSPLVWSEMFPQKHIYLFYFVFSRYDSAQLHVWPEMLVDLAMAPLNWNIIVLSGNVKGIIEFYRRKLLPAKEEVRSWHSANFDLLD